ncbi:STAS-like domain-containing protein [Deinococcus sp. SM5_A1]|uniref:STAS-like domain-containing protein n=1 Tax=Deinococcus sp. SM5_A1 TaxID=3379094 RepID=UPI00385CFF68
MKEVSYSVAEKFSKFPAGRVPEDGKYNGERFRNEVLIPLIEKNDIVHIFLDGTRGYGSSFLEESFGGLVRYFGPKAQDILSKVHIKTKSLAYRSEIKSYIDDALKKEALKMIVEKDGDA